MQPTPRLRVFYDRIPRVFVFVYFCRGLSGNTEERPTRRVYIEILTCAAIFYHLEESRSHGNEREAERAWGQGTRPPPKGARLAIGANQAPSRGSCCTTFEDQGKLCDYGRFDPTAHIHLEGLYKQAPWSLEGIPLLQNQS